MKNISEVSVGEIKIGDRVYHDGAYRKVAKSLDCGGYIRFEFSPAWGEKRVNKADTVSKWQAK